MHYRCLKTKMSFRLKWNEASDEFRILYKKNLYDLRKLCSSIKLEQFQGFDGLNA